MNEMDSTPPMLSMTARKIVMNTAHAAGPCTVAYAILDGQGMHAMCRFVRIIVDNNMAREHVTTPHRGANFILFSQFLDYDLSIARVSNLFPTWN